MYASKCKIQARVNDLVTGGASVRRTFVAGRRERHFNRMSQLHHTLHVGPCLMVLLKDKRSIEEFHLATCRCGRRRWEWWKMRGKATLRRLGG